MDLNRKNQKPGYIIQNIKRAFIFIFIFIIPLICCKRTPTTPDLESLTLPVIWLNSFEMSFAASEVGPNPSSQIFKVKNSGQKTLSYTLSDDADWLSIEPSSGTSTGEIIEHTISVDKSGLDPKDENYTATITISSSEAYNNPQKATVTLILEKEPPPEIWVSPASLSFSGKEGGPNPSSQNIKIKNSGQQTLNYKISDDANWLDVSPKTGSSQGVQSTHTVSVDISGLSEGSYTATITIADANASNSPQTVVVTLTLSQQSPPQIWVNTTSISFSAQEGGSDPFSQNIKIRNSGEQTLNYSISDDANWLDVSPKSGSSQGAQNTHTVSVDISGLNEGSYTGTITISDSNASNSPQTVDVTLTLSQQSPPQIWVNTTSLSFNAQEGDSNPSSQNIKIRNSGEQTLNYSISDDANWLDVSPTSGSSTGERNTHTVSLDISGLSSGSYTGTITITDSNASNNPQSVGVTLTIITQSSPPEIWVNTNTLSFNAQEGGSNPSSQNIKIKNSGEQTLNYSISDDANWLDVSPTSGSSQGATNTHSVSVDISGLSAGSYNGTITISDPNASNSPQTVDVSLSISGSPTDNKISISCSPSSGGTDTIVTISISVKGNLQEINYFGLDLTFDTNMFQFQKVNSGSLTGDWASVDGNEISSGTIRIGGFAGSGTPIAAGSTGGFAVVKLKVTCNGCSNGQQAQFCITNYQDDIRGMTPEPSCTTFTYNN